MDDKKKLVLLRLSDAAEIITTFEQLEEYASQAATIIQGPWTQEMADAAKNLPSLGGTADIVAISKDVELEGGAVVSGAYALGLTQGEVYGLGAVTIVGIATALVMVLSSFGVGYDVESFEADHELWHNILDTIKDVTIEGDKVPVVVTPENKTYVPKALVDKVKDAVYDAGYFEPYTVNPYVSAIGTQHFDLINLDYPIGTIYDLATSIRSKILNDFPDYSEVLNNSLDMALEYLDEHLAYNLSSYYVISANFGGTISKTSNTFEPILSVSLLTEEQMVDFSNTDIVITRTGDNPFISTSSNVFRTFGRVYISGNYVTGQLVVSNASINNTDNSQVMTFSDFERTGETSSRYNFDYRFTGFGTLEDDLPSGMKILPNSLLPNNENISDIYPSWNDEAINVAKYNPQGAPTEEMPFVPIEMPRIDGDTTQSNQDDVQKGDIVTIPQEMPLVVGQRALQEIIDPTENPETPDPLIEPIPEINPESPAEVPDSPVNPETTPQPEWIPDPPYVPDPPVDPDPGTEPLPDPIPLPQPIPAPTNPPAPPVDDGTSPVIVLPPVDPNNGIGAVYNPTRSELRSLSQFLWSTNFIDQIKKLFQSPVDGIISLHQLYVSPVTGGSDNIYCGYLDSGVSADVVTNQFVTLSCGSVTVPTKYNNALDYSPYTKVSIYLPFVGIRELDADDVIGATVDVTYRVDVLNGACLASVKCSRNTLNAVLYTFEGNCSVQLPVSGATFGGPTAGAMVATAAIVGTAVTGGAASTAIAAGAGGMIAGSKTNIQKSGNFSGNAGALGSKIPYIIITRPIPVTPVNYHLYYGLPSHVSVLISSLTGYTRVKSVHIDDISSATDEEKRMIESILKDGFIA